MDNILNQAVRIAQQYQEKIAKDLGSKMNGPTILERAERRLVAQGPLYVENIIIGQNEDLLSSGCICRLDLEEEQLEMRAFGKMAVQIVTAPNGRFCIVEAKLLIPGWVMIDVRDVKS